MKKSILLTIHLLFDFFASMINLVEIGAVQYTLILKNAGVTIETQPV